MTLGKKISLLRKQKHFSQQRLAELANVSRSAVYSWEKDDYLPEGANLINLASALETSVAYLMDETDNPAIMRDPAKTLNALEMAQAYLMGEGSTSALAEEPTYVTKSADDLDEIIREMGATAPEIIIRFRNMRLKWHELSDAQKKDVIEGMNYVLGRIPDDGTIFKKVGKKGRI